MPVVLAEFPANDPAAAAHARLASDVRALQANQEQARAVQAYAFRIHPSLLGSNSFMCHLTIALPTLEFI